MTNVRVKFQRSAYGMAYYKNEITPNRRKQSTSAGRNPSGKTTAENL
jgi:hypothetical protein